MTFSDQPASLSKYYVNEIVIDGKDVIEISTERSEDPYLLHSWCDQYKHTLDVTNYTIRSRPGPKLQALLDIGYNTPQAIEILDTLDTL